MTTRDRPTERRFAQVGEARVAYVDTETPLGADWTLPVQVRTMLGLLDDLGLEKVAVVGHDQGGAIAQLIAAGHPERISALVLADAEAYDNWPSADELPFVRATQLPVLGRLVLWSWSRRRLFRWALATGKAVHDRYALTDELVDGLLVFPPEWGRRLQRDIPGTVRVEILPGTGHLLMEERPCEVADLIGAFLREHQG